MGRQGNLKFVGTENGMIFYKWKGDYYIRRLQTDVHQTEKTKQRSGEFGRAARLGKQCRTLFNDLIPNPKSKTMQNELGSLFFKWISTTTEDPFPLFNFDPANKIEDHLKVQFSIESSAEGNFLLKIPELNPAKAIKKVKDASTVCLSIGIGVIFEDTERSYLKTVKVEIPIENRKRQEEGIEIGKVSEDAHYLAVAVKMEARVHEKLKEISAILTCIDLSQCEGHTEV